MQLPEQIKKYRQQYNFSQETLAMKVYVSRQTISNWENGRSYPDVESLLMLATLFGISLDTLIKGDVDIMKRLLDNHDLNLWTSCMLTFLILGIIVGIPLTYFWGKMGMAVAVTLFILGILASVKVERIKKKYSLRTYQEIIDFTEGRETKTEVNQKHRQGYWKTELLMIIGAMGITLVLSGIVLMFLHVIFR